MSISNTLVAALCAVLLLTAACRRRADELPTPTSPCGLAMGDAGDAALLACDGGCIDPRTDPRNCGSCGRMCPQGCSEGQCAPPKQLAAGYRHTCVLLANGMVRCWGANEHGQVGDGTRLVQPRPVAAVPTFAGLTAVAAGGAHTCAIGPDQKVVCWGANDRGQLGLTAGDDRLFPTAVPLDPTTQLALGANFSCALLQDRRVACWGANDRGQLGDGSTSDRGAPAKVLGLSDVVSLAAGRDAACALRTDGTVWCWGSLRSGQNPNGPNPNGPNPSAPPAQPSLVYVAQGLSEVSVGDAHWCVRLREGKVLCRGSNDVGELGTGIVGPGADALVVALDDARLLLSAGRHNCALSAMRGALCWGSNVDGELGDGTMQNSALPVPAVLLANATALAIGPAHGCAITGLDVLCWGQGRDGQLGDGTLESRTRAAPIRW